MENEKKNTALVPYKPQPLALQRKEVTGKTEKPIEKPKKNWKKIGLIIGGSVLTVAIIGGSIFGAYYLGTQKDQDEDKRPGYEQNITEEEINEAANIVHENWTKHGIEYSKEDVIEIIKALNGMESTLTIDAADEALMDVLNAAIVPGVNNVLAGESNETHDLDFASLILGDPEGLVAVEHMEDRLNGCLTDSDNLLDYCEQAFVDEALIVAEQDSVDGMSAAEGTTTPAGVRIVWSRLTLGVNAFAGTLGDELSAEVEGQTYSQSDLNDGVAINNIATQAKRQLGSVDRSITMQ